MSFQLSPNLQVPETGRIDREISTPVTETETTNENGERSETLASTSPKTKVLSSTNTTNRIRSNT